MLTLQGKAILLMEIPLLNSWKSHIIKGKVLKALDKLDLNLYIPPIKNTLESIGLEDKDKGEVITKFTVKLRELAYNLLKEVK
jgi:hypothetical protein